MSPGFRTACSRSAYLSWLCVPSPAACTRNGCRDRSTCTACRNAVQNRTSDTSLPPPLFAEPCRTGRNAKRSAFPADSQVSVPMRGPNAAGRSCAPAAPSASARGVVPAHCPDNPVDGISPQEPPQAPACILNPTARSGKYPCREKGATDLRGFDRYCCPSADPCASALIRGRGFGSGLATQDSLEYFHDSRNARRRAAPVQLLDHWR